MKAVILAGGLGSRISEETFDKPKPMINIGNKPILWHIMKIFYYYGVKDFIICAGYKSDVIKNYFINYQFLNSDFTINTQDNKISFYNKFKEDWSVTIVDTGLGTMTGGRLKNIYKFIKNEEFIFFTYGDGVANININKLLNFHKKNNKLATMTVVNAPSRFGVVELNGSVIKNFYEKPYKKGPLINGGFFVLNPEVIKLIKSDKIVWEEEPIKNLVRSKNITAYKHNGFWHSMDTQRDKFFLESLWSKKQAPWKIWN